MLRAMKAPIQLPITAPKGIDFDELEEVTPDASADCNREGVGVVDWITVKTGVGGRGPVVATGSNTRLVPTMVPVAVTAPPAMPVAVGSVIGSDLFTKCREPPWTSMDDRRERAA